MLQWALFAGQVGLNLFQQRNQMRHQAEMAELQMEQQQQAGEFQRAQIRRAGEQDAADRQRAYRQTIGAQRAAMGQAGVVGGRSARVLRSESAVRRDRAQLRADQETSAQIQASHMQHAQQADVLARQLEQSADQALWDTVGMGLEAGQQAHGIHQQQQAQRQFDHQRRQQQGRQVAQATHQTTQALNP